MARVISVIALGVALVAAGYAAFSWAAHNPAGLSLRALGQTAGEAYVFGYPMVVMDETRRTMLAAPDIQTNRLHHRRDRPGHGDEAVVRPNRDTLYSLAWLDLTNGPAILRFPETDGRYWLAQVMDAWTDVAGVAGSRTSGRAPGAVMIAGPGWDGPALPGMARIEVDTRTAWLLIRVAAADEAADLDAARRLQDRFMLTAPSHEDAEFARTGDRPADAVAAMAPAAFFERLAMRLAIDAPREADHEMIQRLEALGVGSDDGETARYGPLARRAVERGVAVARARLAEGVQARPYGPANWRTALDLGDYGTDYALRAGVALMGLGANRPEDAIYPSTDVDSEGRPLNGAHTYQIRFEPPESGEAAGTPPARAFWSLTAYDETGFLQDAPRHALGDRSDLIFDADGGLTLTIGAEKPEGAPEQNWLPVAPDAPFQLTARLYDPVLEAIAAGWSMPPVERLD